MTTGPRPERDVEIAMMANRAHHIANTLDTGATKAACMTTAPTEMQ